MKLLLREKVEKLGEPGDIVDVTPGYGRNYLLPRRLAVELTQANIMAIEAEKRRRAARDLQRIKDLRELAERIHACDITLHEYVSSGDHLYGSISVKEILTALSEEGIQLEPEHIKMEEPIKTLGVHTVKIRLHPEVETELKIWIVEKKEGGESTKDTAHGKND